MTCLSNRTRLTEEQRLDWLRLIRCDNIGPRTFHDLVKFYGGVGRGARRLARPRPAAAAQAAPSGSAPREQAEAELRAARASGIEFFALGEPDYPSRLEMIDDPPPLVAMRGDARHSFSGRSIAIVGSRNASAAGVKFAERMARDLGDAGYVVVSGLARGIDAAAHRASLETGTIAVLAGGHRPHLSG